jgi:hypothetical protein
VKPVVRVQAVITSASWRTASPDSVATTRRYGPNPDSILPTSCRRAAATTGRVARLAEGGDDPAGDLAGVAPVGPAHPLATAPTRRR